MRKPYPKPMLVKREILPAITTQQSSPPASPPSPSPQV